MKSQRPAPKKVAKPAPKTLYDINVCAPEYFTLGRVFTEKDAVEFCRRAAAFYDTMDSLGRAVMLCRDRDENTLYLASVEATPHA